MVNTLGAPSGTLKDTTRRSNAAMSLPTAVIVHWYGTSDCREPDGKWVTGRSHAELDGARSEISAAKVTFPSRSSSEKTLFWSSGGCHYGKSYRDLPTMSAAFDMLVLVSPLRGGQCLGPWTSS
jgi:hypothetical protein